MTFCKNAHSHIQLMCDQPSHICKQTLPLQTRDLANSDLKRGEPGRHKHAAKGQTSAASLTPVYTVVPSAMLSQCTQVPGLSHCQTGLGHRFSEPGLSALTVVLSSTPGSCSQYLKVEGSIYRFAPQLKPVRLICV